MDYIDLMKKRSAELYYPDFEKGSSRRWYQHDIDTIVYSEMFRKMQRKAQLLSLHDPVSRSRLIHTFEVVRIAKEISEKLGLNSELTEAIALAHDFGNVAYGKEADLFLGEKTKGQFRHEEISALMLKTSASRIIPDKYREVAKEKIARDKSISHFINIDRFPYQLEVYEFARNIYYVCMSPEVIDGIEKHGTTNIAFTLEGQVVNYADNIAYLIQDISDFEASGIFDEGTIKRYSRCLNHLVKDDTDDNYPLAGIVGPTTSIRTATLIERFVSYNLQRLKCRTFSTVRSTIFDEDIPILANEDIVEKAINCCWKFKEEFYDNDLIKISNIASRSKMEQVWEILENGSYFRERNSVYNSFEKMLSSPLFHSYKLMKRISQDDEWENWKKAYFIAHLTCDEIDQITRSFLERDFIFDLSLPTIG